MARLEAQVSSLRSLSAALDASAAAAAETQPAMFFQLQAAAGAAALLGRRTRAGQCHASPPPRTEVVAAPTNARAPPLSPPPCRAPGNELAAARAEADALNSELNALLVALEDAAAELGRLLACPAAWLLTAAAERGAYDDVDAAANDQFWRCARRAHLPPCAAAAARRCLPRARGVTLARTARPPSPRAHAAQQGHAAAGLERCDDAAARGRIARTDAGSKDAAGGQPGSPAAAARHTGAAAAAAAHAARRPGQGLDGGAAGRTDKVRRAAAAPGCRPAPPRPRGRPTRVGALPTVRRRREAHAARNAALMQELTRQRHAFLTALRDVVRASAEEAGVHMRARARHPDAPWRHGQQRTGRRAC